MKKLLSVFSVLILGVCMLLAQNGTKSDAAQIAGKWQMSLDTPHGPMKGPLEVKQEGTKLTGTYQLEMFGTMPLTGSVDGEKVSFNMEVQSAGMTLVFTGKVEGDKMSGSTDHAGAWTATRQ